MKRREFLASAAAVAGVAGAGVGVRSGWAQQTAQQAKLNRIGIMTWSLDPILKVPGDPADPARTVDIMDVPRLFAERYGVHNIEMQHAHFPSTELADLQAFRAMVERAGSRITQINVELGALNISVPDRTRRLETIDLVKQWIDHAVVVGCPRVMVNQGTLAPEVRQTAIEALRTMGRYGDSRSVWVTMENRGGGSWEAVEEVVRAAGTYTTPDMGNFVDQDNQLRGIRALFPMHRGNAHVKLRPERYDLPTALRLTEEIGYTGIYSIEAGSYVDPDRLVAIQKIKDVLMATL